MLEMMGDEDFQRIDDKEAHKLRLARAEERIRRCVRRWKDYFRVCIIQLVGDHASQ